jgi:C_GCAxxG_C_C family probable redox protein
MKEIGVTPEEIIAKVKARAKANFKTGLNCAESVFEAVSAYVNLGLPHEAMCVMTGFGGGGGLFGDTCGSLVGAMATLGAVYGRREVPTSFKTAIAELDGNPGLYRLFNRLPNEFKRRFGSTQCRLLTSPWRKNWLCRDHIRFCRNLTIEAAGLAAEMAFPKDLARWGSQAFGDNVEGRE